MCIFNLKALHITFKNCLENECLAKEWKKQVLIPVHKKGNKHLINNFQPISLLPFCVKVFKKIISIVFLNTYTLAAYQTITNLAFTRVTLACISYFDLKAFDKNPSLEMRGVSFTYQRTLLGSDDNISIPKWRLDENILTGLSMKNVIWSKHIKASSRNRLRL